MKYLILLALALLLLGSADVWAQAQQANDAAGTVELNLLKTIVTGNIGFAFGLIVTIVGLFIIIKGNFGGGLTMIILGVLVTLAPSVYNMVYNFTCPLAEVLVGAKACGGNGNTP